ncbi:MAG: NUDIX domain-containing protein [Ardenticatenia bacterium]|nr:NUDIX domain-containing protein [Ardenticatenia bacterium]
MSTKRTVRYRAAGGVVLDAEGRVLLLERDVVRHGRLVHEVRLPKGHVEPDESDREAALREVREESGYDDLAILADLGTGRTEFDFQGKHVVRDDHYFLMCLRSPSWVGPQVNPSGEEALFRVVWAANLEAAQGLLTFDSEREFVRRAQAWFERQGGDMP